MKINGKNIDGKNFFVLLVIGNLQKNMLNNVKNSQSLAIKKE